MPSAWWVTWRSCWNHCKLALPVWSSKGRSRRYGRKTFKACTPASSSKRWRVGPLRGGQLTRLVGDGMPGASIVRIAETASSDASVIKRAGRAGSHTLSTSADIRAAWSCSKLRYSTAIRPHQNVASGCVELHRKVSGAAKVAKPLTNLPR